MTTLTAIADRLALVCTTLTLVQLALLFAVSERTLERWIEDRGFPAPLPHKPGAPRHWLPKDVLAWVLERIRIDAATWDIEAVCRETGRSRSQWARLVKAKEAPAPIARTLGSGKDLWAIEEVRAFLDRTSDGLPVSRFPAPRTKRTTRRAEARAAQRLKQVQQGKALLLLPLPCDRARWFGDRS